MKRTKHRPYVVLEVIPARDYCRDHLSVRPPIIIDGHKLIRVLIVERHRRSAAIYECRRGRQRPVYYSSPTSLDGTFHARLIDAVKAACRRVLP